MQWGHVLEDMTPKPGAEEGRPTTEWAWFVSVRGGAEWGGGEGMEEVLKACAAMRRSGDGAAQEEETAKQRAGGREEPGLPE